MQNIPEKWLSFYEPHFVTKEQARAFVEDLERLNLEDTPHPAKIMMHQVQRLVTLADTIPKIRPNNETLPLLFLLICAEHIAKIFHRFDSEGHSRAYVRKFFEEFVEPDDQRAICTGITNWSREPLTLTEAIHSLYEVRCDVVHEGKYWGFHFNHRNTPMMNGEPDVIVTITLDEFRDIIVRGAINAIQRYRAAAT